MPEWAKVLLGSLALMIGASLPPLISIRLNPPSPSGWEAQRQHQDASAYEHQYSKSKNNSSDTAPVVRHNQSEDNNAVASKAKDEGQWYTNPDWWVAGCTGGLVLVTGGLWIFTALLWNSTRGIVNDEKEALRIAKMSAQAARDSADVLPTLERAYLFIELAETPFHTEYADREERIATSFAIRYQIANHGKTPAIIKSMFDAFKSSQSLPDITKYSMFSPAGTIIIASGDVFPKPLQMSGITTGHQPYMIHYRKELPLDLPKGSSLSAEIRRVDDGETFLWFFGYIIYDDVFGKEHHTSFCWRYSGVSNTFQQYGDDHLNRRT